MRLTGCFGEKPVGRRFYPRIKLQRPEEEDLKAFADAAGPMIDRGLEVSQDDIREKFGLPAPKPGAKLMMPSRAGSVAGSGPLPVSNATATGSPDPKTGAPKGIDKGWAYAPGAAVAETVSALSRRLEVLPARPSIDLLQSWLRMDSFSDLMKAPQGSWPLARIPDVDALALGSKPRIASLSAETAAKQEREHPELLGLDYLMAQRAVDMATRRIQDGPNTLIYVHEEPGATGYVLVVKVTKSGDGLFVSSFRRISADARDRDQQLRRLSRKGPEI